MTISVIKRDGSIEPYSEAKIERVAAAAGATDGIPPQIAQNVTAVLTEKKEERVSSTEIRDLVIKELQKFDQYAADMFTWYEKTKEKK